MRENRIQLNCKFYILLLLFTSKNSCVASQILKDNEMRKNELTTKKERKSDRKDSLLREELRIDIGFKNLISTALAQLNNNEY